MGLCLSLPGRGLLGAALAQHSRSLRSTKFQNTLGLEMRSLVGGGRSQKATSGGCVSAIQMCRRGLIRLDWEGCFLVCPKAAGAIVRSVVTGEIKCW